MKVIKADHKRYIDIPGVAQPVLRPVDIDKAKTGFSSLRSLRIYHFEAGSVIDGHAEEDEVVIVVLAGSIQLTLFDVHDGANQQTSALAAVTGRQGSPCAAYLPPNAAYRLVATTKADVAYARATPAEGPPPVVFITGSSASGLVWEEKKYPKLLRVRAFQATSESDGTAVTPIAASEHNLEALVHVRTDGVVTIQGQGETQLASWDTLAVAPGENAVLQLAKNTTALILVVLASPA